MEFEVESLISPKGQIRKIEIMVSKWSRLTSLFPSEIRNNLEVTQTFRSSDFYNDALEIFTRARKRAG